MESAYSRIETFIVRRWGSVPIRLVLDSPLWSHLVLVRTDQYWSLTACRLRALAIRSQQAVLCGGITEQQAEQSFIPELIAQRLVLAIISDARPVLGPTHVTGLADEIYGCTKIHREFPLASILYSQVA